MAGSTMLLPVAIVMVLLAVVDAAALFYWLGMRRRRNPAPRARAALAPMRRLAEVVRVSGVLLIGNALWLTILGALTQAGITTEATAKWSALAGIGVQVQPEQPVVFGARALVVAAAVWLVGFGLMKASGEQA